MATLEELRRRAGVREAPQPTTPTVEELRARAATPGPPIPEPRGIPTTLGEEVREAVRPMAGRLMALAEGATIGALPEVTAGATSGLAMLGVPGYEEIPTDPAENLAQIESMMEVIPPLERAAYGAAGGLATGIGAVRALPGLYSTIPRAAGTTAAEGAIAGAFYAPPGERATGAAIGGGLGGMFGLAAPAITRGIRNWWNSARGGMNAQQRAAVREALTALERDQITPDEFFARAERIPGFTIMDMPYARNVQGLARGRVESQPGPGQRMLTRTLMERARGQRGRISDSIQRLMGAEDFGQFQDDLIRNRERTARRLYAEAEANLVGTAGQPSRGFSVHSDALDSLRNTKFVQDAEATVRANFPELANASPNDMRLWDQIYKEMGSQASSISNPNRGYAYSEVLRRTRDAITDINPEYGAALEHFAGAKALENALEQGRRALKDDDFLTARFIRNMTEGERESYLVGVARGAQDLIDQGNLRSNVSERLLSPKNMRKLRAALGSTRAAREFTRDVLREATFARTKQAVVGGSPTARIQAEQAPVAGSIVDPLLQAAQGDLSQAGQTAMRRYFQSLGRGRGIQPERQQALAEILLGQPLTTRLGPVPIREALAGPQASRALGGMVAGETGPAMLGGAGGMLSELDQRRRNLRR